MKNSKLIKRQGVVMVYECVYLVKIIIIICNSCPFVRNVFNQYFLDKEKKLGLYLFYIKVINCVILLHMAWYHYTINDITLTYVTINTIFVSYHNTENLSITEDIKVCRDSLINKVFASATHNTMLP